MELFRMEHKKLWRKGSVRISAILCFAYITIFGSILSFQWFAFGSVNADTSAFGNNFDGYFLIRDSQQYALVYEGDLTDETMQRLVGDYQNIEKSGAEDGLQKAMDLIPLVGSGTDIFRTNTFNIFGKFIWSPYLLIVIPVLIGVVCMSFAVRN